MGIGVEGYLMRFTYPIQFEANPIEHVDRVISEVMYHPVYTDKNLTTDEVIKAIDAGLASDIKIRDLCDCCASEKKIREFLAEMKRRLEERMAKD